MQVPVHERARVHAHARELMFDRGQNFEASASGFHRETVIRIENEQVSDDVGKRFRVSAGRTGRRWRRLQRWMGVVRLRVAAG